MKATEKKILNEAKIKLHELVMIESCRPYRMEDGPGPRPEDRESRDW